MIRTLYYYHAVGRNIRLTTATECIFIDGVILYNGTEDRRRWHGTRPNECDGYYCFFISTTVVDSTFHQTTKQ